MARKRRRRRNDSPYQSQGDNARKSREALQAKWQRDQAAKFRPYHNFDEPVAPPLPPSPRKMTHLEYLASDLWRITIRPRILDRDRHVCRVCFSNRQLQVHHISYEPVVLKGNADHLLITLCHDCHSHIEFDELGQKRHDLPQKRDILFRMMVTRQREQWSI